MKKYKVAPGLFWVEIPEAGLYIQCGCPADSVKHLMKKGFITDEEIEDGTITETGPNVILLSDLPLQKNEVSNLGEFSVLQMLYRQGMILPNHPNNTGIKPMLVGINPQIEAQAEYIYRGNYGLISEEEIMAAGVSAEEARDMMRLKLKFAFGKIRSTKELIETKIVGEEPFELRNEVFLERKGINLYEISYKGKTVKIDLTLESDEEYKAPYELGYHRIKREYFSVVHNGEGDGWDPNRPCMGSIVMFQGKIYLIDAGPNIVYSLQTLGIGISEIEGIFHTHAHDDHFGGITALLGSDRRIRYYSTKLVRHTVMKKLSGITSMDEELFEKYFEVCDLEVGKWNNIFGLEVKPVNSPHPLETTIMFFRVLWGDGYKTYAHLADIASLNLLEKMITDDPENIGISAEYYQNVKESYLEKVDLKKIDIGGGMIHGDAHDFKDDQSRKILLSHRALPLRYDQKEIGDSTSFGAVDTLISTQQDYSRRLFYHYFKSYFPNVPQHEINMLLSCPVASFNPGSIMIKSNERNRNVFFIMSGLLEYIDSEGAVDNKLTVGSMVGELSGMQGIPSKGTCRAISYVDALSVPCNQYIEFLKRNGIFEDFKINISERYYLQNTWLFGEGVSCPQKSVIAREMVLENFMQGDILPDSQKNGFFLLKSGKVSVCNKDKDVDVVLPGGYFGVESVVAPQSSDFFYRAEEYSEVYRIEPQIVNEIPVIHWKLLASYKTLLLRCLS